jgi:hypothetical protein
MTTIIKFDKFSVEFGEVKDAIEFAKNFSEKKDIQKQKETYIKAELKKPITKVIKKKRPLRGYRGTTYSEDSLRFVYDTLNKPVREIIRAGILAGHSAQSISYVRSRFRIGNLNTMTELMRKIYLQKKEENRIKTSQNVKVNVI